MRRTIKQLRNIVAFTGIWILPVGMTIYISYQRQTNGNVTITWEEVKPVVMIGLLLMLLNMMINLSTLSNGKKEYGLLDALNYQNDPYMRRSKKLSAMRPPVPEALQGKSPCGVVLGRKGKNYVINDPATGGAHHTMVLGVTGCGKTSTIVLDTILCNPTASIFAVDIKEELYRIGTKRGDNRVIVISPTKPGMYGYDPFFALHGKEDNVQAIVETMQEVSLSLIPVNAKSSNPFWEISARDLLCALLIFYFQRGDTSIIDIVDDLTAARIEDVIETVFNEAAEDSPEHRLITRYVGMATETLSGINAQMMSALSIFVSDENIRRMFRDNSLKANPKLLNHGKSLYLAIEEEHLERYARIVHLVYNQTVTALERRKGTEQPVIMIVDELARILSTGKLAKLENSLETLRSRNVTIILISQSVEALERAYSKADIEAVMNNCPFKMILSATSKETQDAVIRWAGKYEEYRYSRGTSGGRKSSNIAYVEKPIVEAKDLITLPQEGECIVISPYGYIRIHKVPYYRDKYISKIAAEIKKHNQKWEG